jgi:hypothetical protein
LAVTQVVVAVSQGPTADVASVPADVAPDRSRLHTCIAEVDLFQLSLLVAHKAHHVAQVILRLLCLEGIGQAAAEGAQQENNMSTLELRSKGHPGTPNVCSMTRLRSCKSQGVLENVLQDDF